MLRVSRPVQALNADRHLPLTDLALGILMALGPGPKHGYGIIKDIEERTGVKGTLRSGTLYTALQRLTDDGLIEPATAPPDTGSADTRRKYFALTSLGKEAVTLELGRLRALVHEGVARKLIAAEPNA